MCIVAISNNVLAEYELDDKIRSRIGTSEIFFASYTEKELEDILKDRAEKAFQEPVEDEVIKYCAQLSSDEHGDARRAVELLRVAAEVAESKKEKLAKQHVDEAWKKLESERVDMVLKSSPRHVKLACASLARIEHLSGQGWHSTSTLYRQYLIIIGYDKSTVSYRRFSQLLREIVNLGLAASSTGSKGRYGYGTEYKLTLPPSMVGHAYDMNWWIELTNEKSNHEAGLNLDRADRILEKGRHSFAAQKRSQEVLRDRLAKEAWDNFVGLKE